MKNSMRKYHVKKRGIITICILLAAFVSLGIYFKNDIRNNYEENRDNQSDVVENEKNEESDQEWNLILVNRWHAIPKNYKVDLVNVSHGQKVDKRIYKPLMNMLKDAKKGNLGKDPIIASGYRTQEKQRQLYEDKISVYRKKGYTRSDAIKEAEKWVSIPGYSEHQLGLAVDINGATYDLYLWLQENSYKYGFIWRYPGDKTDITGIKEEMWHYRYVGQKVAKEIYDQKICLEEYLNNK